MLPTIVEQKTPLTIDAGGTIRIAGSRVSLDSIIYGYMRGATVEQIADDFPTVSVADLHASIAYYLHHRAEIDEYLRQQARDAESVREAINSVVRNDLRDRLIARQHPAGGADASGTQ
jgi:uncharacterized protein (DUF433 family)